MSTEDLRQRILRVATALFADKGYGSTSVREVVDAVGVTKPTLYYWFGSKDALFVEAVDAQLARMHRLVDEHLRGDGETIPRLRAFTLAWLELALSDRDGLRLLMSCQHNTDGQPAVDLLTLQRETVIALTDRITRGVASGELRAGLDPSVAATSLLGGLQLYVMAVVHGMPAAPAPADALVDLFLHGAHP